MLALGIETSSPNCSIALFDGERLIAVREETVGRGHAERLIPWIAELPGGGRADLILVGCGPGSFTGVRVGIAAARGLALGWGIDAVGISSLALIAARFGYQPVTVAIEGGHGELFVQDFARGIATSALASLTPEAAAIAHQSAIVAGSGAHALIMTRGFGEAHDAAPSARDLPALYRSGAGLPPVPVYGRGADARPMAP